MTTLTVGTVALFVASDPALGERLAAGPGTVQPWVRIFAGLGTFTSPVGGPPREEHGASWALPADHILCAQRLLDAAKKLGRKSGEGFYPYPADRTGRA